MKRIASVALVLAVALVVPTTGHPAPIKVVTPSDNPNALNLTEEQLKRFVLIRARNGGAVACVDGPPPQDMVHYICFVGIDSGPVTVDRLMEVLHFDRGK